MDRGKGLPGRGGKSKTPHYPADLFALGSKGPSRVDAGEPKRPTQPHSKPVPSHGIPGMICLFYLSLFPMPSPLSHSREPQSLCVSGPPDRKREAPPGMSSMMLAKKPKVTPSVGTILSRGVAGPTSSASVPPPPGVDTWETVAIDTEPSGLVVEVLKANDLGETDKVVRTVVLIFIFDIEL